MRFHLTLGLEQTKRTAMTLEALLKVPDTQRDETWEDQFLTRLTESEVNLISADPQTGPDQWPYLMIETLPEGGRGEPTQRILEWLSLRGIGLVVNPNKDYPDFVMPYGMIWNFRRTGRFIHRAAPVATGPWTPEGPVKVGDPSDEYLPGFVRKILREFFRDQNVFDPRILMVSNDGQHFDLAFSLESLGNPPEKEYAGVAEAISWFLPGHYSIVLMAEQGQPFKPL